MVNNTTDKKYSNKLPKFNLFLIICISIAVVFYKEEQEKIVKNLLKIQEGIINQLKTIERIKIVDFAEPSIQSIDNDQKFLLAKASQKEHLTGIKFVGRIINTSSVDHLNITFKLSAYDKNKKFTINKISSGNSTGFKVYIPDIKAQNSRYAKIEYIESTIRYYTE